MKKLFMMLALASASVTGMAQNEEAQDPTLKYSVATNSFWSNWFVQANATWTAFYGNQETVINPEPSKSPIKDFRRSLGFSVAVGKWFTPGLGLRTKFNGIWGKDVQGENCEENSVKYWNIQEQALFNLSNMLCGYNEKRVWNFIPYAGAGVVRNMSADKYAVAASVGILNTFRVSKKVAINLDLNMNLLGDDFSYDEPYDRGFKGHDRNFQAEVGITYNLGKTGWSKTPDVDAIKALSQQQIDALNAQLSDAQDENGRLKKMLADEKAKNNRPVTKAETKVIGSPVSVFFNLGKSKIASKKDLQNVKELAQVAKDNNTKLVVTGYADSKTGSAEFNKQLSQKRAEAVADELVKMGVDRSNIEVKSEGGVDTLSPISYNRRATVTLK